MKRITPRNITLNGWRGTLIIMTVLFFAAIGVVFAYNTVTTTYPNPSTATTAGAGYKTASQAASFGHTADELNVYLGTGGTEPCTGTKTLQDAIANKCLGGTSTTTTTTTTSMLGDSKCTARGGIVTGDFKRDIDHRVRFSQEFPSGVKPIVIITPDITAKPSSSVSSATTALSLIKIVDHTGFLFQTQADLKYLHFTAFDPACFPPYTPPSESSSTCSGVTDGKVCSSEWDCCPSTGGAYHCRNGKWLKLAGTQCV